MLLGLVELKTNESHMAVILDDDEKTTLTYKHKAGLTLVIGQT